MFSSFQVPRRRTNSYVGYLKEADEIDCGSVKVSEDFMIADIDIHPRHAKQTSRYPRASHGAGSPKYGI